MVSTRCAVLVQTLFIIAKTNPLQPAVSQNIAAPSNTTLLALTPECAFARPSLRFQSISNALAKIANDPTDRTYEMRHYGEEPSLFNTQLPHRILSGKL